MIAAATSASLWPLCWEWSRSISKAVSLSITWRAIRIPFACSISGAASEGSLQAVVFGEALQGDVDRALQLLGGGVDDVGEDAALGRLVDVGGIPCREQRDHRAGGFVDDLADQFERVF